MLQEEDLELKKELMTLADPEYGLAPEIDSELTLISMIFSEQSNPSLAD